MRYDKRSESGVFSIDSSLSLYFMDETENHNRIHRLYSVLWSNKQSLSCLDEDLAYGRYPFVTNESEVRTKISLLWMYCIMYGIQK